MNKTVQEKEEKKLFVLAHNCIAHLKNFYSGGPLSIYIYMFLFSVSRKFGNFYANLLFFFDFYQFYLSIYLLLTLHTQKRPEITVMVDWA